MATKYYIAVNSGFQEISGPDWYSLLQEQKALQKEQRKHFIYFKGISEYEDSFYMEATRKQYDEWRRERGHARYIQKQRELLGLIDILYSDFDNQFGEEIMVDLSVDLESEAIHSIELSRLGDALAALDGDELKIINELYLIDKPIKERELSRQLGIPQKTLNNRKLKILAKLKKLFGSM